MSQQNPIQEQIIARTMKDEAFRQELLSNPKAAIEHALGINVPQDVTIAVHEDTPTTFHLVLPARVQTHLEELSDAELEQATGGFFTIWLDPFTTRYPTSVNKICPATSHDVFGS